VTGGLWLRIRERTERALRIGALRPVATERELVEQAGVRFLVRVLAGLAGRQRVGQAQDGAGANPFLPYEPDLFVARLTGSHVCLLNKFNVVEHHVLIVTRRFVDQERLLEAGDFRAVRVCLAEIDGLAFYNGGRDAGASQPHRHLQLVPLPLLPGQSGVPMDPLLPDAAEGEVVTIPGLPFRHAFARTGRWQERAAGAGQVLRLYHRLLRAVGGAGDGHRQGLPYNLLLTREWMLLVPRSREHFGAISLNALAFAGALLVRERAQLEHIRHTGPLAALAAVGLPR
jgi:ATP adenylyltransferase